jgi:hypothetical protein
MPTSTSYPTGAEYRDALFNTGRCFNDPLLKGGVPITDSQGMPKPVSGNFATVFTVTGVDGRKWGVKCFTRHIADQRVRYERISASLGTISSSWRVPFDYISQGILCNGLWYPILRMEWIEASALIPFIERSLWQPGALARLAKGFADLVQDLSRLGIAHGDLQHGNLLVTNAGGLKLVDYDGMYVPGLEQLGASELGHPNYQSPARSPASWGPMLDRFSAWLIYCSLTALTIEPTLWGWLHRDGDEALIFAKKDFLDPTHSLGLRALARSNDERLQALGRKLEPLAALDLGLVPPFDPKAVPEPSEQLVAAASTSSQSRTGRTVTADPVEAISEWLASLDKTVSVPFSAVGNDPSWVFDHLPTLERITFRSRPVLLIRGLYILSAVGITALVYLILVGIVLLPFFCTAVGLIAMLVVILPLVSLLRTAEWKERSGVRTNFHKLRGEADRARKSVAKAEAARKTVDRREREELDKLSKLARNARNGEHSDLKSIEADLAKRLSKIESDLRGLSQAEERERVSALRMLQQAHLDNYLTRAKVASAHLPGIGRSLRVTLQAHGISSAADFTGISYAGSEVFINLRFGRRVHPYGMGTVKAQTLEAWRRSVEAAARATQPSVIPGHQASAIRLKYTEQRMALERSTNLAKSDAARKQQLTEERWALTHANITARVEQVRKEFSQYRTDADLLVIESRRTLNSAAWYETLGKHRLASYAGISYRSYVASGLRG